MIVSIHVGGMQGDERELGLVRFLEVPCGVVGKELGGVVQARSSYSVVWACEVSVRVDGEVPGVVF